jgi:hypothetical protein
VHIDLRLQVIHLFSHVQEFSGKLDAVSQVVGAPAPLPFVGPRPPTRVVGGAVAERIAAAGEEATLRACAGDRVRHSRRREGKEES